MNDRRKRAVLEELYRRKQIKREILDSLHPKQRAVADDPAQYRAVVASRRAGKTWLDISLITISLLESGRDVWSMLIAPTGLVGKSLVWNDLVEMDKKYQLGWKFREFPSPEITTPAGAKFGILGATDAGEIAKLRGKKYALIICDEAREYARHLRELIEEIAAPAFMGVGGKCVLTGTPGRVCTEQDYFYHACHGKPGWSRHWWTLHHNSWLADPEAELAKVLEHNQWTRSNVIFRREYLGEWVSDTSERVYAYNERLNSVQTLADVFYVDPIGNKHPYDRATWIHTLSVDFGYSPDPSAWNLWASHPKSRDVYAVYSAKRKEMLSDEAALETARLVELYRPLSIVGDGGGLGSPYLHDYNRRHADRLKVWMKQADKKGKRDHIEIVGEEMKVGRVFVVLSEAGELAKEYTNLGWKDETRMAEHPSQPNHCADAALYGFMEHKALYHKPEAPPLSKEEQALADRRARTKLAQSRQTKNLLR